MNIEILYQLFSRSSGITTDTRKIASSCIFFALRGDRFDGNSFAKQALLEGAAYVVIDNKDYLDLSDKRMILVDNVLETLQNLAGFHRQFLNIPIVGITGTNGKTTTKELIRSVLSKKYKVYATQGNLNNHIGVPLTLLSMSNTTDIGVVEMGANHPFEIKALAEIAQPNIGLITNVGKGHLDGFGGFEGVKRTKKELYDYLADSGGTILINSDNALLKDLLPLSAKCASYGALTGELCRGKVTERESPYLGSEILFVELGSKRDVKSNLVGNYNFENILAACAVGLYYGVAVDDIVAAVEGYVPGNNRSQLTITAKNKLLLDCYNANPSSTEAAIVNFSSIKEQNKVVVLGDMLELGDEAEFEHKRMLKLMSELVDTEVFVVGDCYCKLASGYKVKPFPNSNKLKEWLSANPLSDRFILIKGSRGMQLEKIVDQL